MILLDYWYFLIKLIFLSNKRYLTNLRKSYFIFTEILFVGKSAACYPLELYLGPIFVNLFCFVFGAKNDKIQKQIFVGQSKYVFLGLRKGCQNVDKKTLFLFYSSFNVFVLRNTSWLIFSFWAYTLFEFFFL